MVTVVDVEGWNWVGLVGVKTALSGCARGLSVLMGPIAMPAITGTEAPRGVVPSVNCTIPAALVGVMCATGIAKPPDRKAAEPGLRTAWSS